MLSRPANTAHHLCQFGSYSKDSFKIGSKNVIVQDCDLRGNITIGSGNVIHPRSTILAMSGPVIMGNNNIIEENVVIVNRSRSPLIIGDNNVFHTAARIESPSIGSYNKFCSKSRTPYNISIGSYCQIGPGCILLASPFPSSSTSTSSSSSSNNAVSASTSGGSSSSSRVIEHLPDYTTIQGDDLIRSNWSSSSPSSSTSQSTSKSTSTEDVIQNDDESEPITPTTEKTMEGIGQYKAFHEKHLNYLRETMIKYHKLKVFDTTKISSSSTSGNNSGNNSSREGGGGGERIRREGKEGSRETRADQKERESRS